MARRPLPKRLKLETPAASRAGSTKEGATEKNSTPDSPPQPASKDKDISTPDTNTDTNQSSDSSTNTDTQTDTNQPLTEFHCFDKLPAELRVMIWKLLMPGPRIVKVNFDQKNKRKTGAKFTATIRIPVLLHVKKETRNLALQWYQRIAFQYPKYKKGFFFDFERDALFFDDLGTYRQRISFVQHKDVRDAIGKVQNLVFGCFALIKELETDSLRRPLPTPSIVHFFSVKRVTVRLTLNHRRRHCPHCGDGTLLLTEEQTLDDGKQAVSDLKKHLSSGQVYTFMFGNEWVAPKWDWLTHCNDSDWTLRYLASLPQAIELTRLEEARQASEERIGSSERSWSSELESARGSVGDFDGMESSVGDEGETPPTSPESEDSAPSLKR